MEAVVNPRRTPLPLKIMDIVTSTELSTYR